MVLILMTETKFIFSVQFVCLDPVDIMFLYMDVSSRVYQVCLLLLLSLQAVSLDKSKPDSLGSRWHTVETTDDSDVDKFRQRY